MAYAQHSVKKKKTTLQIAIGLLEKVFVTHSQFLAKGLKIESRGMQFLS